MLDKLLFGQHTLQRMMFCVSWMAGVGTVLCTEAPSLSGSMTYYLDSRAFPTASLALSNSDLPLGFALWGFTDWHGDHDQRELALTRSFSEYRLSHQALGEVVGIKGLGLQGELNATSGHNNDVGRIGLTYAHQFKLPWPAAAENGRLQWRLFPYETDGDGGQFSLIYYIPVTARSHIKGFADYNYSERSSNRWVIEPEFNVRLSPRLWALLELRYNGFERHQPALRGTGLALGLRYQF